MAPKFINKLMVLMMDLLILILTKVHPYYPTLFSSTPMLFPSSFVMIQQNENWSYHCDCLKSTLKIYKGESMFVKMESCIIYHLFKCPFYNPKYKNHTLDGHLVIMQKCLDHCFWEKNLDDQILLGVCQSVMKGTWRNIKCLYLASISFEVGKRFLVSYQLSPLNTNTHTYGKLSCTFM